LAPDPVSTLAARLGAASGSGGLELERQSGEGHGDYATNAALRLAGARRRPPRELAAELVAAAEELPDVERAEIAGPGFVNLFLRDEWFVDALAAIVADEPWARTGTRIQVEMVSANPTGPITVASARNGAYGDSVARLLELVGNDVEREYYYNDSGAQMDRFRASVDAVRRGEAPPADGYRGAYIADLARHDGDPVALMREQIEDSLERFHIHFDSWARQSVIEEDLPELLAGLPTYEKDGAVFVSSTEFADDKDRVLIRSAERGGSPTYEAADIAYLKNKLDRGFDHIVYVLGADHHGVAKWYEVIARMLGYDPERVEVLLYQLVHLTKGGEQTKMSKRRGDVVFLDDFIDEIGLDAARWYLVNRGPDQTIEIDVDLAAERSQKNPVYYVQYAHARIAGILRNARPASASMQAPVGALAKEERDLIKRLAEFPSVVKDAAAKRGPQAIPAYAIRVADDFHRFYHEHRVLESEQEAFRLDLCRATQRVIAHCLELVGVDSPDRM
jgi:arginyl-tRNA synthetase